MKRNGMEREERWIETLRRSLQQADEPLPEGGWEALERDLAAAGRRRRVFDPVWKRIAAAAAVVVIAVGIGETVVHRDFADDSREAEMIACGLPPAEELPIYNKVSPCEGEEPASSFETSAAKALRVPAASRSSRSADDASPRRIVADAAAEEEGALRHEAARLPEEEAETAGSPVRSAEQASSSRPAAVCKVPQEPAVRAFAPQRPVRRTSVGFYAAGLPTAQHVSSGRATPVGSAAHVLSASGIYRMKRGYDDYLYRHKQPLSFGVSVGKGFGHGLSLESGLVYSLLRSDVRVSQNDDAFAQTLHMLGIPLKVNWAFLARSDWRLYVGAGGMVEKALYAKFGDERVAEKTLQWSLNATAGVQYDFTRRTALYFEPGVSYYLTQTDLRTARTASPVNLSLQLGVRLTY